MSAPIERRKGEFAVQDFKSFKIKMLNWASRFGIFLFLDSNGYTAQGSAFAFLLGAGALHAYRPEGGDMLAGLRQFHRRHPGWLFGHMSYGMKDVLEPTLSSRHQNKHPFPLLQFVVPDIVIGSDPGASTIFIETAGAHAPADVFNAIVQTSEEVPALPRLSFEQRISRPAYIQKVEALREHIRNGDCYEINLCSEGFREDAVIDPVAAFHHLNERSPAPFAACYRLNDLYLMCASPERYLRKSGRRLFSQPIKGTAPRGADPAEDTQLREALLHSEKERAEHVMIVDLVRNDLARSCTVGSVQVDELYGIHTFPQVHQMISTISGTLAAEHDFDTALRHSFPMGSMTGAPKVNVMSLIEQYEETARGLFSGSVGYISPAGDFDFNVVIRSLFYNKAEKYLSYQTGGAITWDSDPLSEWEERSLKASALERIFSP